MVNSKVSTPKNRLHTKGREGPQPKWQERLLPIMAGLIIGLTLFFFLTTFGQMAYLHWNILQMPEIHIDQSAGETLIASAETFEDRANARELEVRSRMEAFIVTQRYHQISVQLMSGLWIRYLGFITGMILASVGASFVLGKLREPTQTLKGKFSVMDLSLRTASPGIILAVLGVMLMFSTIINEDTYSLTDSNIYLSPLDGFTAPENLPIPTLLAPEKVFSTVTPSPSDLFPSTNP